MRSSLLVVALAAALAHAKTDIAGCVSSATKNQYNEASVLWYVPGTGEICEILDCGGGRAPPKTTVPGCAQYKGTATYSPKYLTGFNSAASTQGPPASTAASITGQATISKESGVIIITSAATTTAAPGSGSSTLVTSTAAAGSAKSSGAPAVASNGTAVVAPSGGNNSTGSKPSTGTPSSTPNAAAGAFVPGAMGAVAAAFAFFL